MPINAAKAQVSNIIELISLTLRGASAMIGLKDLDHRYIYTSVELEAAFGIDQGSLIGNTIDSFISAENAAAIREKENQVIASDKPARSLESFSLGEKEINCVMVRFPFRDESGVLAGIGLVAIPVEIGNKQEKSTSDQLEKYHQLIGELQQTIEDMKHRTTTDPLTGAWNRSRIAEAIHYEAARFIRYGHPASLIFIDLDHFKRINDTYGHLAGDSVLVEFCLLAQTVMRSTDMLGRWGGEEFIMVLPNTSGSGARFVAERLREEVEAHSFPAAGKVTASFGVAVYRRDESMEDWIGRADKAVYRAKDRGRNCVELSDSGGVDFQENIQVNLLNLSWQSQYESGNPLIDREHRGLFDASNQILSAVMSGESKSDIALLFDALIKDIEHHFNDEEDVLKSVAYPGLEQHVKIHEALLGRARQFADRHANGELSLGDLFSYLAYDVITKHLLNEDRKFFSLINERAHEILPAGVSALQ